MKVRLIGFLYTGEADRPTTEWINQQAAGKSVTEVILGSDDKTLPVKVARTVFVFIAPDGTRLIRYFPKVGKAKVPEDAIHYDRDDSRPNFAQTFSFEDLLRGKNDSGIFADLFRRDR